MYLSYNACMAPDNVLAYLYVYASMCYICVIVYEVLVLVYSVWYGVATINRLLKIIGLFCKKNPVKET